MSKPTNISAAQKIAIQGYEGSFHQEAARHFFGKEVEVIPCDTFRKLITLAEDSKQSDGGVMAIENSIAGSILANYNLLHKSKLKIAGEVFLQIRQQLMVNPGVKLQDIREVHSHTMALQQCYDFLNQHHFKLIETEDTALSAKLLKQHKSKHVAAVASKLAAKLYGLDIIAPNIQSSKNNYTRFLLLQRNEVLDRDANKASIYFKTNHTQGSLVKVLNLIADAGINLSKLQSFPIPGSEFKYSFHADMEFKSLDVFYKVMEQIQKKTEEVRVYGIYKKGLWK
jgi:prephenate dehydratase